MRRLFAAAVLAALCAALIVGSSAIAEDPAGSEAAPQTETAPAPSPVVTKTEVKRPSRQVTRRHKFVPWASPTYRQVRFIIAYEAARWGASASHLSSRIYCESRYNPGAQNGQYHGLGQFAESTFWRGWRTIHTKRVRLERITRRWVSTKVVRHWSDGRVTKERGRRMKQRVRHVRVGRFQGVSSWHGWAQVRIMAQAMTGRSAVHDSEWSCR